MKKYYFIAAVLFAALLQPVFAQKSKTDANIVGDVQCKAAHVPFLSITIDGTTIGTTADATGHFQLTNLPEGTHTLRVSGVGYKSVTQSVTARQSTNTEIKFIVEEDILDIEGVVVSADRNRTNRSEAPVIVTSINPKLFSKTQSVNIAEGLCYTPGLRTECNCTNCGFTQLRMNGLDGPYTQILLNSRPVFSGLAGVYGLELIPANMVERLEVVRGGGSALFGGNAIAGTVNIITKEPTRNTFSADGRYGVTGVGAHEGESTAPAGDAQLNLNTSVVSDDNKSGAYIYAMLRKREAHDENGDGFTESVVMINTTFGFNVYHKPGSKSKISLDGYRINEFRRGGNMIEYVPHAADVAEQVEHTVTGANLAYDYYVNDKYDKFTVYAAGQTVERDSYYGANQDPNAYGHTDDFTSIMGAQYILNAKNFLVAPASTVFGIDNTNNLIKDKKLDPSGVENTILTHQMVNTFGTFVQQDWKGNKLNLALGLRYDNYMIKDMHGNELERAENFANGVLAPRFSALYKITPNIKFRVGYAKGYRAPQVFNEDLHIELVNAKRIEHINAPNLVEESSHSFSSSIYTNFILGSTVNDFLMEGFYTRLENAFADEYYQLDTNENWAYLRVNAKNGAYVTGLNFEYNMHFLDKLDFSLGFTLQKSLYKTPQKWGQEEESVSKNFLKAPNQYGYSTLTWNFSKKFGVTLALNYTGSMLAPHFGLNPDSEDPDYRKQLEAIQNKDVITGERLEYTEQFLIADLLIRYVFNLSDETKLEVYGGMKNISNQSQRVHDKGVYRDAGYIYGPCQPRTINLGLKIGNY